MLALDDRVKDLAYLPQQTTTSAAFRAIYGFYPFVDQQTIYIMPGEVRFNDAEIRYYDAAQGIDSGRIYAVTTATYSKSGLLPNTSGVLYLEIPLENDDFIFTYQTPLPDLQTATEFVLIGSPSELAYYFTLQIETRPAQAVSETWSSSGNSSLKDSATAPVDAPGYFRKILCDYTVNSDGIPSVTARHLGPIHIPQAVRYQGQLFIEGD